MDLETCPRCKEPWARGFEKCRKCGFVPIGAGIKRTGAPPPKKKARYREPGSSWGCLWPIFLGLCIYGMYRYQPWVDDWEMVRSWFGAGRHHNIQGEWDVVQVLHIKKDPNGLIGNKGVQSGVFNFRNDGGLSIALKSRVGEATADGKYLVNGVLVAVNGLKSSNPEMPFPDKTKLSLAWTGGDQVMASTATEVLYLRRKQKGGNPLSMVTMKLKDGITQKGIGTLRGPVTNIQNQLNEVNE